VPGAQEGTDFFLEGESGELRYHNIRSACNLDLVGFDTDRSFMPALLSFSRRDLGDFQVVKSRNLFLLPAIPPGSRGPVQRSHPVKLSR
jgi:hypothetical protein